MEFPYWPFTFKDFIPAIVGAALLIIGAIWLNNSAYQRGYDARRTEQLTAGQHKIMDATKAREDAARCAADPNCSVRPDQYQRD